MTIFSRNSLTAVATMKGSEQVQCQVERSNRVGEGTGGDGVDACGGDIVDGVERDAAAGFEPKSTGIEGNGLSELGEVHVIEENQVDALEGKKVGELFERGGFQLDAHAGMILADAVDGGLEGGQGAIGSEMIVFDHHGVVETHAMVDTTTGFDGFFFKQAPAWGGFAGIPDFDGIGFDGVDVAGGHGGDPGEALKEIEGGAFGGEQRASATFDFDQGVTGCECATVRAMNPQTETRIHFLEDRFRDRHAGDDAGFARDDARFVAGVFGDEVDGGNVTGADVFSQSGADEVESRGVHEESGQSVTREMRDASAEVLE